MNIKLFLSTLFVVSMVLGVNAQHVKPAQTTTKQAPDPFKYKMEDNKLKLKKTYFNIGNVFNTLVKKEETAIFNDTDQPMTITFSGTPKYITMAVSPKVLPPKSEGLISMEYRVSENKDRNGKQNWGYQSSRIRLTINGNTVNNRNNLSIRANIQEDFASMTPEQRANAPKIVFAESNFNFGTVQQGESVVHEFLFTNNGKTDLEIRKVKGSWGCTAASTTGSVVKPGQSSTIKATFRTKGKKGPQSKTITVTTNDPDHSTMIIKINGQVKVKPKEANNNAFAPVNKTMAPKAKH